MGVWLCGRNYFWPPPLRGSWLLSQFPFKQPQEKPLVVGAARQQGQSSRTTQRYAANTSAIVRTSGRPTGQPMGFRSCPRLLATSLPLAIERSSLPWHGGETYFPPDAFTSTTSFGWHHLTSCIPLNVAHDVARRSNSAKNASCSSQPSGMNAAARHLGSGQGRRRKP